MKRLFSILAVVAALTFVAASASAQLPSYGKFQKSVYSVVAADDTDVAIVVRYIGPRVAGATTVQVALGGNITFVTNGAADTSFECPVAAPLGGIIDTTNIACNELGEVVDSINSSRDATTGQQLWAAFILDGLRTDSSAHLLTAGPTDATPKAGFNILWDTSDADQLTRALVSCRTFACQAPAGQNLPVVNPYLGTRTVVEAVSAKATFDGGGTGTWTIYGVVPTALNASTVTTLWTQAGAATTVVSSIGATTWPLGLVGPDDAKIVVRYTSTGATSTYTLNSYALTFLR